MNKGDLINAVADSSAISKDQATDAVNCVFSCIESTLKKKEKATFVGFGTFSTAERAARDGRNPSTGATIRIAAKTQIKFKPGKVLSDVVNG